MTDHHETSARIAEEHEALRRTLDELETATDHAQLIGLLGDLRTALKAHFEEEEGDEGLMQVIRGARSQQLRHLKHLFAEHATFLGRIDTLAHRLNDLEAMLARIHDDTRALCADLRRHEARETELLAESVFTDIGTGD